MTDAPKFPPFNSMVCVGDSVSIDHAGFTFTATIHADDDATPPDERQDGFWPSLDPNAAGYIGPNPETDFATQQARAAAVLEAWKRDDWYYCGVIISAARGGVTIAENAAALWGIEANYPDSDNSYLSETADELLSEAVAAAEKALATVCGGCGAPAAPDPVESRISERAVNERAEKLVRSDVHYCASALVAALLQATAEPQSALFSQYLSDDDVLALASREPDADDYSDCAPDGFTVMQCPDQPHEGQGAGMWEWFGPNSDASYSDDEGSYFETELEAWQDAYAQNDLDQPEGREIYEHWIISDWLADKLEAEGETVARDIAGLTIWGRTTTGQAIYMDFVIQKLARDMLA